MRPGSGVSERWNQVHQPAILKTQLLAQGIGPDGPAEQPLPALTGADTREQLERRGVILLDALRAVDQEHRRRQAVQQLAEAVGQPLLLGQLDHALAARRRQLLAEPGHPLLQLVVGIDQLLRHLVEHQKGVFQLLLVCRCTAEHAAPHPCSVPRTGTSPESSRKPCHEFY